MHILELKDIRVGMSIYDDLRKKRKRIELKHFKEYEHSEKGFKARYIPVKLNEQELLDNGFIDTYENINIKEFKSVDIVVEFEKSSGAFNIIINDTHIKQVKYLHELEEFLR